MREYRPIQWNKLNNIGGQTKRCGRRPMEEKTDLGPRSRGHVGKFGSRAPRPRAHDPGPSVRRTQFSGPPFARNPRPLKRPRDNALITPSRILLRLDPSDFYINLPLGVGCSVLLLVLSCLPSHVRLIIFNFNFFLPLFFHYQHRKWLSAMPMFRNK